MPFGDEADMLAAVEGAVIAMSDDGRIVHATSDALALLGWDLSLIGQPLVRIIPSRLRDPRRLGLSRYVQDRASNLPNPTVRVPTLLHDGTEQDMDFVLRAMPTRTGGTLLVAALSAAMHGTLVPGLIELEAPLVKRMNELI